METKTPSGLVEFIPAADAAAHEAAATHEASEVIVRAPWEQTLSNLANKVGSTVTVPRSPDLKRSQVVNAFHDAFQLVGGTPRLAIWANENPTEFFKLYAKLAPRQVEQETKHDGGLRIVHVLPRGKLDE